MKTLIENLHTNNVIFSYYGFIDDSVLSQVLKITRSKLESNNESSEIVDRVHTALNECVENIINHNFFPLDERVHYKSLLAVSKQDDHYLIGTINVINTLQKNSINDQLDYLKSKTKEELVAMKAGSLLHKTDTSLVSSALIDLVLKADNCECAFKDRDANFLFNINFKINSLN